MSLVAGGEGCAVAEGVGLHGGLRVSSAGTTVGLRLYAEERRPDNTPVQRLGALRSKS